MKIIITICAAILMTTTVFAQSPNKMSYQAVIRNTSNTLVTSTAVGMRISILQTTPSGTAVYVETQTPTTNANGLVSIEIGGGTVVTGNFANINWANGPYFVKTETDPIGGSNYTITGTSQLLSVPYALYAAKAGNIATIPSLSTVQRDSIPNPATGLLIYNNTSGCFDYFNGTAWIGLTGQGSLWYADNDGDGYGNTGVTSLSCNQPQGYVNIGGDCNDNNNNINPGMNEMCDGVDQNCDGVIDEGLFQACYSGPAGNQNVGICQPGLSTCVNGIWGVCIGEILPSAEICNGLDDNCNGQVDEGASTPVQNGNINCSNVLTCNPGFANCDGSIVNGCEVNLMSSPASCGACGNACPMGMSCINGVCQ